MHWSCGSNCQEQVDVLQNILSSLVAQRVKNLPAIKVDPGLIPGWEDPLEQEMATHLVFLPNLMDTGSLAGYSAWGSNSRTRLSDYNQANQIAGPGILEKHGVRWV